MQSQLSANQEVKVKQCQTKIQNLSLQQVASKTEQINVQTILPSNISQQKQQSNQQKTLNDNKISLSNKQPETNESTQKLQKNQQCCEHAHNHAQEQDQEDLQNQQQIQQQQQQQQQQQPKGKWKKIHPPEKQVKLFMIDFAHCDAKKCSGKKLQRFKLLSEIKDKNKKYKGIVLSAFGKKQVSLEDLEYAEKYGVCVVDCSWNRIQQTRQFRFKHQRKLPFVTAGNPVNYGKPYQLSCAQALATALCSIGYIDQAQYIMSKFGWADGFWTLNPLIQNYSKCKTLDQLKKQSKIIEQSGKNTFQRNYDLSDPSSQQEN